MLVVGAELARAWGSPTRGRDRLRATAQQESREDEGDGINKCLFPPPPSLATWAWLSFPPSSFYRPCVFFLLGIVSKLIPLLLALTDTTALLYSTGSSRVTSAATYRSRLGSKQPTSLANTPAFCARPSSSPRKARHYLTEGTYSATTPNPPHDSLVDPPCLLVPLSLRITLPPVPSSRFSPPRYAPKLRQPARLSRSRCPPARARRP